MDEELSRLSEDGEETLICVGKFDVSGFPIVTSRHLGTLATATLQTLSLASLLNQTIQTEPLQELILHQEDGSIVRVEPHEEGFIAYLQMPRQK
jgi:predicted regulator of Ras-like GTPase activity (Roadblock/LC7/MglB family)